MRNCEACVSGSDLLTWLEEYNFPCPSCGRLPLEDNDVPYEAPVTQFVYPIKTKYFKTSSTLRAKGEQKC